MENDIILEGNVAIWRMQPVQGDLGGTYTGTFKFRTFLDPLRQLQAGKEFREYLGAQASQAPDSEANLAFALTQLKFRVISAPPFWTSTLQDSGISGNVGDLNVIALVLDSAIRAETLYKEKIAKERDEALERSIQAAEALLQKKAEEEKE